MNSTTIALVLFLAAMCGWMWWRIRRMPASPATQTPAISAIQPAAEDDLDLLCQVPAEYAGRPDLAQVVLLNDDTTPMDLVMLVLQNVFQFSNDLAVHATIATHTDGECVIAVLPRAVAAGRIAASREVAEKTGGYPLQIIARPLPDEADQLAAPA